MPMSTDASMPLAVSTRSSLFYIMQVLTHAYSVVVMWPLASAQVSGYSTLYLVVPTVAVMYCVVYTYVYTDGTSTVLP